MSVLHCMMMSHGGELLARYRGLNQSHHEYVLSADSSLKGYEEKVANMTGLELQVAALKKQVFGLNDKLTSSDASFAKSKAKGKERKKKIKSLGKSLDNLHAEVARLSAALNQATILEAKRDEEILRLKTTPPDSGELLSLAASAGFERVLSMHRKKDEFVVVLMKMVNFMPGLKPEKLLSTNVNFTASTIASEHNEKMVNAEVDGSDPKMTDDTAAVKYGHAFVQDISIALDDVAELVEVGSGRVPSGLDYVVVAFSAHEKGDGLDSSSAAGEEAAGKGTWYAGEHLLLRA
ncbi:hypothetical protein Tco_0643983 [Tanacetum coccineum]